MRPTTQERPLPRQEIKEKKEALRWLRPVCFAAATFLFAGLRAFGSFSPFAAAFFAAVPFDCAAFCLCGGALGLFSALPWQAALAHTLALVLIGGFRFVLERRFGALRKSVVLPVVAACAVLACGLGLLAFQGVTLSALLLLFGESAAAFVSCGLFLRVLRIPVGTLGLRDLAAPDSAVLGLCGCLLLLCASSYTVFGVSPARILTCFAVLVLAGIAGAPGGALSGLCAGLSLSVLPQLRFLLAVYAVPGLAAGVLSPLGPVAMALFFASSAALTALLQGMSAPALWCLLEIGLACAAYALTPAQKLGGLRDLLQRHGLVSDVRQHMAVSADLLRAAAQVGEISGVIREVGGRLDRVLNPELELIFARLQQSVCQGCPRKTACWHDRYAATAADILAIADLREEPPTQIPLLRQCPRAGALQGQVEKSYADFVSGLAAREKIRELRGVVGDQFDTMADFLQEIASLVRAGRVADPARGRTLREALADAGQAVDALHYLTDADGRVSVEITMLEDAFSLDFAVIRTLLERLTGRRFAPEEIALLELRTTVTFHELARLRVLFGKAQIALSSDAVCGDCVQTLTDPNGNRIALLSDGMGTGARAAVDAVLTVTLLEKLLKSGIRFPAALRLCNCALLVKSSDESIATADGLCVNVYTGRTSLYKAGAAVSFLRRGNQVTLLEAPSLPIGILRTVGFAKRELTLESGDIVLLVSDGVTAGDCGWLSDELLAWSTNNMDDLASHIASLARLRSDETTRDDITVVAAKVLENRTVAVTQA
jgi:stage II sporulation protein E